MCAEPDRGPPDQGLTSAMQFPAPLRNGWPQSCSGIKRQVESGSGSTRLGCIATNRATSILWNENTVIQNSYGQTLVNGSREGLKYAWRTSPGPRPQHHRHISTAQPCVRSPGSTRSGDQAPGGLAVRSIQSLEFRENRQRRAVFPPRLHWIPGPLFADQRNHE